MAHVAVAVALTAAAGLALGPFAGLVAFGTVCAVLVLTYVGGSNGGVG